MRGVTHRGIEHRRPLSALLGVVLLAFLAPAVGLSGQDVDPADVSTIDGIIQAYYEVVSGPAGAQSDVARDRALHHPDAWVAIAGVDDTGRPTVTRMTLDEYHGANPPRQQPFWEWETAREVRRSGNMVHVWSSYASATSPGGDPFDRGVNSITLFWDGTRWWIMGWMFDGAAD